MRIHAVVGYTLNQVVRPSKRLPATIVASGSCPRTTSTASGYYASVATLASSS